MSDLEEDPAYRPVSCATHDQFEIAILHRTPLRLRWIERNVLHDQAVTPVDIETTNHQEFLIARSATGETVRLRLDWIRDARPI
ncbi:MAG: transcriptional antiterminator, Rof [Gammaproteobacteria bacterium]|nr:transcriptional antiterminator, Rof [Gammaproteobacteria bacterium]